MERESESITGANFWWTGWRRKTESLKEIKIWMECGKNAVVKNFMKLHTCFSCLAQPRALSLRLCSCNRSLRDICVTCHVACHVFFCDGPKKRSFIHYNNCAVGYSTVKFSCCCLYRHRALMYKQCQNSAELMILFETETHGLNLNWPRILKCTASGFWQLSKCC